MSTVLLLGSGGREHALAWKITQSSSLQKLYIAPGNPGTAQLGENVDLSLDDFASIAEFLKVRDVKFLVVGPEAPLVEGISDYMQKHVPAVTVIGPSANGAKLEGSKDFCKDFLIRHGIPTAKYKSFTADDLNSGLSFLKTLKPPYVLKADGLAAGKGVVIVNKLDEAEKTLREMLIGKKFGQASSKVVIEEFLKGIELSVFIITDGKHYKILPEAKDYKRIGDGDTGLNTGGMGAVSPVPFADKAFMLKVDERVIQPTVRGLNSDKISYQGFLFIGLMNVNGDPYVIEFNVRLGDPETEVVMLRLKSDIMELFDGIATGTLGERHVEIDERVATTVMMVSGGYPEEYEKHIPISIGPAVDELCFHAGTASIEGKLVTNGGRVMAVSAYGRFLPEALSKCYEKVDQVSFEGKYYRKDIGQDVK